MFSSLLSVSLFALPLAYAASIPRAEVVARQSITTLSTAQVSSFKPFSFYASAAYCQPAATLAWNCGANCNANSKFIPTASGGDGDQTQFWYVGYDPTLNTVIVAHQGTDTSEILPILEDGDIILSKLDSSLFPGLSSSIEAHNGFAGSQSRSANAVLAAVQKTISAHPSSTVTVVGHSLGAAIGLIDTVYLRLHLPTATTVQFKGYGMPRVGNQAFANYVDATFPGLISHVNNKKDIVPILPGRFLGYHHPSGEIHVEQDGTWDSCPGQDNTSKLCIVGAVPNIFEGDESDHDGPYDGVQMGC